MNKFSVNQTPSKKAYQQPQLKTYGDLRRLTQAGSTGGQETSTDKTSKTKRV